MTERANYPYFTDITTRWMDNDIYGHVNNVVYYSYFDSVANKYLIEEGGLDIQQAEVIGFVVASACEYKSPIAYPEPIEAGFRVNKLGNSSVEYGIAIFQQGQPTASAVGPLLMYLWIVLRISLLLFPRKLDGRLKRF